MVNISIDAFLSFLPFIILHISFNPGFSSYISFYAFIMTATFSLIREKIKKGNDNKSYYSVKWHFYLSLFTFLILVLCLVRLYLDYSDEKNIDLLEWKYHSIVTCIVYFYRSLFMHDVVERKAFTNSFFSSAIFGRTMATIGEISFMRLFLLYKAANEFSNLKEVFDLLYYGIWIAECLCYIAVFTKNQIFHFYENSIWTIVFSSFLPILYSYSMYSELILVLIYVVYMISTDLPMYFNAWKTGECGRVLSLYEGVIDCFTNREVTKDDSFWIRHMEYMTLNFTIVPLVSLYIVGYL